MLGGNLHRSTDAMEEAGSRISKYLLMQLLVNVSYGIPMALGLWLIGVPGWILWGTLAALMRFIPYVGPMLSAAFPIALSFAVDPGWTMVLLTIALILSLELVSNNIVEPMLYGTSTGLSAMSLIAAATFWTALWGPVGLILSTPLTVCLLVIGRNLPALGFLETLLGSAPALDISTRIYQRLLANDPEEAIEIAGEAIDASSVPEFYHAHGIGVLRQASADFLEHARAERMLIPTAQDGTALQTPADEDLARTAAVDASAVLDGHLRGALDTLAARAAEVFDVRFAVVSVLREEAEVVIGQNVEAPGEPGAAAGPLPRASALCDPVVTADGVLVVDDTARDPLFADRAAIAQWEARFYAGAPLRTSDGLVLGALCLLDPEPRTLAETERTLLADVAAEIASVIAGKDVAAETPEETPNSATLGQQVPR